MRIKLFTVIILSACFLNTLCSQNLGMSPYGRYGLGEPLHQPQPQLEAIGGGSNVSGDSSFLNFNQPASLLSVGEGIVIIEGGILGSSVNYNAGDNKKTGRTAGLAYVGLSFPVIKKKWTSSLCLTPLYNAGFRLKDTVPYLNEQVQITQEGTGGISAFLLGNAFKIGKNLQAGINLRYLFGKIDYSTQTFFISDPLVRNSNLTKTNWFNGFDYTVGLNACHRFKNRYSPVSDTLSKERLSQKRFKTDSLILIGGLSFTHDLFMNQTGGLLAETYLGNGTDRDTLTFYDQKQETIKMPYRAGLGITLASSSEKWLVNGDLSYTDWNSFRSSGRADSNLVSSFRISSGFQYYPNPAGKTSFKSKYLQRIRYRAGVYYSDGYLKINGHQLPETGFSIGFGLPFSWKTYFGKRATHQINICLTAGRRGNKNYHVPTEQFFRAGLSISFNDRWFHKRVYE